MILSGMLAPLIRASSIIHSQPTAWTATADVEMYAICNEEKSRTNNFCSKAKAIESINKKYLQQCTIDWGHYQLFRVFTVQLSRRQTITHNDDNIDISSVSQLNLLNILLRDNVSLPIHGRYSRLSWSDMRKSRLCWVAMNTHPFEFRSLRR